MLCVQRTNSRSPVCHAEHHHGPGRQQGGRQGQNDESRDQLENFKETIHKLYGHDSDRAQTYKVTRDD
jgi:hypothetical protein